MQKSLSSNSTTIVYDLEDSVHASAKEKARERLGKFLQDFPEEIGGRPMNDLSIAVRPNNPLPAHGSYDGSAEAGAASDILSIWEKMRPRLTKINCGAGPAMLMPKVRCLISNDTVQ